MKGIKICDTKNMTREEWLNWRMKGIGGSDAGAILGVNKHASPLDIYNAKLGIGEPQEENERMWFGTEFEQNVAKRFSKETGKKVRKLNAMIRHKKHEFMLANVDRVVVGEDAILECKTMGETVNYKLDYGEYPLSYHKQCVHYMSVLGAKKAYLAIYKMGEGLFTFTIDYDKHEAEELIEAEHNFWFNHVLRKVPPLPDGSKAYSKALQQLYPENNEKVVPLFGFENLFEAYKKANDEVEQAHKRKEQAKQEILLKLQECSQGQAEGYIVNNKEYQGRISINTEQLKYEYPDAYEACKRQGEATRRFSVKEVKETLVI